METVRRLGARARFFLRAALILSWVLGVSGSAVSCLTLKYYQGPRPVKPTTAQVASASPSASGSGSASVALDVAPSVGVVASTSTTASISASTSVVAESAPAIDTPIDKRPSPLDSSEGQVELFSEILERFRSTRIPVTIANLLLSLALVVGAARAIARRPGGSAWLRQVCVATAIFAVTEHVVARKEREFMAERFLSYARSPEEQLRVRSGVQWAYLLKAFGVALQLGLFGGLAVALGRASVKLELAPRDPARRSLPPPSVDE